jgi:hypothetical protein
MSEGIAVVTGAANGIGHDSDRRRAALSDFYTEDATLCDPDTVATGLDAISAAVGAFARQPPARFRLHLGWARCGSQRRWASVLAGGPDGPVGITGIDFVHVEGGRIKMLYVFLDSAPG